MLPWWFKSLHATSCIQTPHSITATPFCDLRSLNKNKVDGKSNRSAVSSDKFLLIRKRKTSLDRGRDRVSISCVPSSRTLRLSINGWTRMCMFFSFFPIVWHHNDSLLMNPHGCKGRAARPLKRIVGRRFAASRPRIKSICANCVPPI